MAEVAAWAGMAGFAWLALFQSMLAAGAPLGHLAWGGADRTLPPRRRLASLAVVPLAMLGLWAMAGEAGLLQTLVPRWLLWVFAGVFFLSLVANLLSASRAERAHGAPLAALLALSPAIVAFD